MARHATTPASGTDAPRVCAVVLNWNGYEHTKQCVESLARCGYPDLRVIVVDNGSRDGSGPRLRAECTGAEFIFNGENLGFARGCNVGIRAALGDERCHYVLLINNDATIAPGGLAQAVAVAEGNAQAALIGGKILQSPESRTIWYAGGRLDRWRGQAIVRGFGETDDGRYDEMCDVGFVTGGLMLIRREALRHIGLLPEEYFFGVEEWDFSLTARRAGYRLLYVPAFLAFHRGDGSHWNYEPKYVYNYYRNKLIFQEKFLPWPLFPLWKVAFILYGALLARRHRAGLVSASDERRGVPHDELDFALAQALRDHRRNTLSESALEEFERKLASRQGVG